MKYLFINDILYLLRKRGSILILLFIIPILFLFPHINLKISCIELINMSMGTNLDINHSSIMELFAFLFNITVFLFLIIDIYIKDIHYQLDNIFIRMHPCKWVCKKNLIFILSMFFIKILSYIPLIIFLILFKKDYLFDMNILLLIIKDFIYILFLQYLFVILHLIGILNKKINFIFYVLYGMVVLIIVPKDIYNLRLQVVLFLSLFICIFFYLLFLLFQYRSRKILEKV